MDAVYDAGGIDERGEHLLQGGSVLRQVRHHGDGRGEASAHHLGGVGAVEGLLPELVAQHLVHLADRDSEAVRLPGEVAAHLVGVQVGLREQVAGAGEREPQP